MAAPGLSWGAHAGLGMVLMFSHVSVSVEFDYCQHLLHGVCTNECDVTSASLEIRNYLCGGQGHCCVNRSRKIDADGDHDDITVPTVAAIPRVMSGHSTDKHIDGTYLSIHPSCGRSLHSRVKRVVGGAAAASCEFPWMVFISRNPNKEDFCGGALVSDRHVITAAHCYDNLNGYQPQLTIAEYNRSNTTGSSKYTTSEYTLNKHPLYNPFSYNHDLAVLTLARPLVLDDYECMAPICLPESNQTFGVGTACSVAGWGTMSRDSRTVTSPVVVKAQVNVQEDSLCKDYFRFLYEETSQICAGDLVTAADSCQGDSGGPFMCPGGPDEPDTLYLAGVISSGANPCGQWGVPAIYSDVTAVRDWLDQVMAY